MTPTRSLLLLAAGLAAGSAFAAEKSNDICWPAKPGSACFALQSPALTDGTPLPQRFAYNGWGCTGQNVSPPLAWHNAPAGTKSFAVTLHDPDAPTGGGWWHWLAYDIPASAKGLAEGAGSDPARLPKGAKMAYNDFGTDRYGGPCPPQADGMHRYEYKVWALKVDKLPIEGKVTPNMVGFLLHANALGSALMTIPYTRN